MKLRHSLLGALLFLVLATFPALAQTAEQQFANLGDFKLDSGEILRDCRIGYRTFGQLDAAKSNAIVFPTWFEGTTQELIEIIGPGKLVDSSKYYVIAMDAIADGISISPSNSKTQPHLRFPKITIHDMVESEHRALVEVLHLNHAKAVMGISMGGMQTFQWMVSYPTFMDKAIPIVGSPRLAPYDLVLWQAKNEAIMSDPGWKNGEYTQPPGKTMLALIGSLTAYTPDKFNKDTTREKLPQTLAEAEADAVSFDANNHIRQSQAMMALDVSQPFSGSVLQAAEVVKAKVLVVVSMRDHMVTPGPALEFAKMLHAEILELRDDCGHDAPSCAQDRVARALSAFLEK